MSVPHVGRQIKKNSLANQSVYIRTESQVFESSGGRRTSGRQEITRYPAAEGIPLSYQMTTLSDA